MDVLTGLRSFSRPLQRLGFVTGSGTLKGMWGGAPSLVVTPGGVFVISALPGVIP